MTDIKNVDDILVPREQAVLSNEKIPAQPMQSDQNDSEPAIEEVAQEVQEDIEEPQTETEVQETENKTETSEEKQSPIDEYGNPVEKPRMYTEEEVQQKIRQRLKEKYGNQTQPQTQQIQQDAKDFKADPNSEESWEQQLEDFVERTIEKRQKKLSEKQWREQEAERQAEFEEKFTTGMSKYKDFHQVIAGKPITNGIMLASRALENPAAFIYGAAKLHPQELDRIARINDPYQQAAEVGRLHEKMVKAKNTASKLSKPLEAPKSDMPIKTNDQPSLEARIQQHAAQKAKRGR